jgi:hypothetical protein
MSLADYLAKTRMPDETAGVAPRAPEMSAEAGLLLVCHDRRAWGFPWSYYIESLLVPAGAGGTGEAAAHDVLMMVFSSREVTLRGRNLAPLHEAIVRHRVWEIRETPERFLPVTPGSADGAPLVVEITVRERATGRGK